jgi:hypothetical protein
VDDGGDAPGIKLKLESRSVVVVIGGKTPESYSLLFHLDFQLLLSIRTHVFQLHAWSLDADPHLLPSFRDKWSNASVLISTFYWHI